MAIDIEHIRQQTETVHEIVSDPEDGDTVVRQLEERDLYEVERERTMVNEHYRVYTAGARGSKSWTYVIEQNDDDEWEVTQKTLNHGRANQTLKQKPRSTEAVREAMRERHGIELAN